MRALILSDIHGNLEALTAVLAAAEPYDALWNLGDVVGYGGGPDEGGGIVWAEGAGDGGGGDGWGWCGLSSSQGFNPVARAAAMWTNKTLTPENLEWLKAVPAGPITPDEPGVTCVHGSP